MPSLTNHLLSLETTPPYIEAVKHQFLTAAANGTLPDDRLALWLSQDRIYASHAYPMFIGALLSNIPFNSSNGMASEAEQHNQNILQILVSCLNGIIRETKFFKDIAEAWNLPIDCWRERQGTKTYVVEMMKISKNGKINEGLIFLWAMEQAYLDSWTHVSNQRSEKKLNKEHCAINVLVNNWSSAEFVEFVAILAETVDNLGIEPGSEAWKRAEEIWNQVVELEVDFWPVEGEERSCRIY